MADYTNQRRQIRPIKPASYACHFIVHPELRRKILWPTKQSRPPSRFHGQAEIPPLDFWTLTEFKQFQEAVKDNPLYHTMYTLLFYTGIRKGELLALTLADFDFAAGTLSISKTYKRLHGQDLIQPPKTEKGNRTINLPPFLLDVVRDYAAHIYGLEPQQRLFESTSVPSLKYNLDKYANLAQVKHIRVHDLRHPYVKNTPKINFLQKAKS